MAQRSHSEGFGFIPTETQHHFLVTIPAGKAEKIIISEYFDWDESAQRRKLNFTLGKEDSKFKVILERHKWNAISDELRAEFNRRLKKNRLKIGEWKTGQIPISKFFGKEMVVLAWAIEDADPALIPTAIKNWLGLAPEERWWLYTMTNAATGNAVSGKNKGWRSALRYALTENPISDEINPVRPIEIFQLSREEIPWSSVSEFESENE